MQLYLKNVFLFFCIFSFWQGVAAVNTTVSNTFITENDLKNWVKQVKKQLRHSKKRKINTNLFLSKFNKELKRMKINTKLNKKNSTFLLNFQLSSLQDLFPLLLVLRKKKSLRKNCSYLKQKIIYDLYPTYEDTKNIKLPYAHKELNKILGILCS